jgi:hypothetical protein
MQATHVELDIHSITHLPSATTVRPGGNHRPGSPGELDVHAIATA